MSEIIKVGSHRVRHGDMFDDLDELFDGVKADMFYSDPPWGEGHIRYWQTMNQKMNGAERRDTDLQSFLHRIFEVAMEYTKDDAVLFFEYGCRWHDEFKQMAKEHGLIHLCSTEMLYGSTHRPLIGMVFDKDGSHVLPDGYQESVYHTSGYNSLVAAMEPFVQGAESVFDPCCGLGYTARFAVEHGMKFYGNEINRKRLDKTIERLSK